MDKLKELNTQMHNLREKFYKSASEFQVQQRNDFTGKTIIEIDFDDEYLLLFFDDDTFGVFRAYDDYGDLAIEINDDPYLYDHPMLGNFKIVQDKYIDTRRDILKEQEKIRKKIQYEQLKKEFESE